MLDLSRRKVRYETKEYATYPAAFPGGVRITTARRETCSRPTSRTSAAAPRTRCSADEVRAKFRENAGLALAPDAVEALEEAILSLEEQDDLRGAARAAAG